MSQKKEGNAGFFHLVSGKFRFTPGSDAQEDVLVGSRFCWSFHSAWRFHRSDQSSRTLPPCPLQVRPPLRVGCSHRGADVPTIWNLHTMTKKSDVIEVSLKLSSVRVLAQLCTIMRCKKYISQISKNEYFKRNIVFAYQSKHSQHTLYRSLYDIFSS